MNSDSMIVMLDCEQMKFDYSLLSPPIDEQGPIWEVFEKYGTVSKEDAADIRQRIEQIVAARQPAVVNVEYQMMVYGNQHQCRISFIMTPPCKSMQMIVTDITKESETLRKLERQTYFDELTGLLTRYAFCRLVDDRTGSGKCAAGQYAMIYFDVQRFKAVNDMFGIEAGDRLLIHIADSMRNIVEDNDLCCRIGSDRFVAFVHCEDGNPEQIVEKMLDEITDFDLPFEITCNAGIYLLSENRHLADSLIDRAIMAQSAIKGSYTQKHSRYTEQMRKEMLTEQEIVGNMATALANKQFTPYFQPQYNHATKMLIGAEALVRWIHPERGLIPPDVFIPIFERNGFITKLDLYVFEQVCIFLRNCLDQNLPVVPISTNFSRHDVFHPDIVEDLEKIREKYDIPVELLRVEITETAVVGSSQYVNDVICRLHHCGYIVEMDDFGSGYSSLNVLKDIDLDIIKLDMKFLSKQTNANQNADKRGGTILSSVVRMAKWLNLPVIAEGVETVPQADFLRSIGCEYIQGYLYSKPLPQSAFYELLTKSCQNDVSPQISSGGDMGLGDFWNPDSQETLIFSNYVGAAAIFDFHDGEIEILRVNQKYLRELNVTQTEKELVGVSPFEFLNDREKDIYFEMLERAGITKMEESCETWRIVRSSGINSDAICVRSDVRLLGRNEEHFLFYATIRNVTAEKQVSKETKDNERRFKMASEQVNMYYWEYDICTKDMYPCSRCMRDLGLPAVLHNYPESAIEMGVIQPEAAETYREMIRQLTEGARKAEGIIVMTEKKIPFRVRYTTEFDASGCPLKAYGSAFAEEEK